MRIIKKYSNRRMYDTESSESITLSDIATLIMEGEEIKVIDNGTKEDITAITFAQIILKQEQQKRELSSVPFLLKELIRKGRSSILELIEKSLFITLDSLSLSKEKAEEMIHDLIKERKIGRAEGQRLLEKLLRRMEEGKQFLEKKVQQAVGEAVRSVDSHYQKEILSFKKDLYDLKRKIRLLDGK